MRAWYLGAQPEEVGEAAILIGNPARIDRIATHLVDVTRLPVQRGLSMLTGRRGNTRITVAAFGMGAPIAAIVLHELHALGIRCFLRIGTAMALPPVALGDFVLAEGALRAEGTSATYAPLGYPAIADFALGTRLRRRLATGGRRWHAGIFGSYDGFYTQMFALEEARRTPVATLLADIMHLGLIAVDMETAAVLTAARVLGAAAGSLCLASVEAKTQRKLDNVAFTEAEQDLFEVALDTLAA